MPLPNRDTYATYGSSKVDYSPVVDPTTDRSATEVNAVFSQVAAMNMVSPIMAGYVSFVADGTVGSFSLASPFQTYVGVTFVQQTTGIYILTLPATIQTQLGEVMTYVPNRMMITSSRGVDATIRCIEYDIGYLDPNNLIEIRVYASASLANPINGEKFSFLIW